MSLSSVPIYVTATVLVWATHVLSCNDHLWAAEFEKRIAFIPMRDGVRLYTEIYTPTATSAPPPMILMRSPYGRHGTDDGHHPALKGELRELADEGYIFAFQDVRGRFRSEGSFVMLEPPSAQGTPRATNECTDAYDTIEWLVQNVPSNGRVGMLGISYDGWLALMALLQPHPALKAVSPQAAPSNLFLSDDFFEHGAFRLSPAFAAAAMLESSNTLTPFVFDKYDAYEWFLDLGPLANANARHFQGKLPSWNDCLRHTSYDSYWKAKTMARHLRSVPVPTLHVLGWWDDQDFAGQLEVYASMERSDSADANYLVIGPWEHAGWKRGDGERLGKLTFQDSPSRFFREEIQAAWFGHLLKGEQEIDLPEALVFNTGTSRWEAHSRWPPQQDAPLTRLYLHPSGQLSFAAHAGDSSERSYTSYESDPLRPVPYAPRPIRGFWQGGEGLWRVTDQRFVHNRPDVISWVSEPLESAVTVSGALDSHIFGSTTGSDCDWIVKVIDVYPDEQTMGDMAGYQLMIVGGVLPARFRNGYAEPLPVKPGQVNEYIITGGNLNHTFLEGHRLMVQIQSSWFPLFARNPQTFVDPAAAQASDFCKSQQCVYHCAMYPSHIALPLRLRANTQPIIEPKSTGQQPELPSRSPGAWYAGAKAVAALSMFWAGICIGFLLRHTWSQK